MFFIKKCQFIFSGLMLVLVFFAVANICLAEQSAQAQPLNLKNAFEIDQDKPLSSAAGEGAGFDLTKNSDQIMGFIITTVLSLVGVVFLVMAIYGGYTWMMARGNEEMVEKAKNTLTNAIIGIVVVMAAYAISYFILKQISTKALRSETEQISL